MTDVVGNEAGGAYPAVTIERRGIVAQLTLNRPEAANALNATLLHDLYYATAEVSADPAVRVIVVTGGGRHFCAGADLRESRAERRESFGKYGSAINFSTVPQPVIAAINGPALGGGCELSLTCDFRLMAAGARIGLPEILFGALPSGGGTARLPRTVPLSVAKRLIMTGVALSSEEARDIGLVDEVVAPDNLLARADEFAQLLCQGPDYAVRAAKSLLNSALQHDLPTALANERATVRSMATGPQRMAARRRAAADRPTYARIFGRPEGR